MKTIEELKDQFKKELPYNKQTLFYYANWLENKLLESLNKTDVKPIVVERLKITDSNFLVKCPFCELYIDFLGDNWDDGFTDDSDITDVDCPQCNSALKIRTDAQYLLSIDVED